MLGYTFNASDALIAWIDISRLLLHSHALGRDKLLLRKANIQSVGIRPLLNSTIKDFTRGNFKASSFKNNVSSLQQVLRTRYKISREREKLSIFIHCIIVVNLLTQV